MKKILIFSLAYYPRFVGGAEVAVKEITDRISSEEYEFHMITNRFDASLPKKEKIGNVTIYRIGITTKSPGIAHLKKFPLVLNKPLFQFLAFCKAMWIHRTVRFDAVWAIMAHSSGIPAALFKMCHRKIPYVLTLQEGDPPRKIERMMLPVWPLFKRAFTKANAVQAISQFLGTWAKRMGFKGQVMVIPNAVNVQLFSEKVAASEIRRIQHLLNKQEGDILLITTSRLVPKNAIDDILRALSFLPSHIKFIVLGTGPDEASLRRLASNLKISDRVNFVGQVSYEEIPGYLQACDIFIRPSRSEGMGNSFVEAMAAGIPVIATQEGGIADFLFDAKRNPDKPTTGWAVDKDDPKEIAEVVLEIVRSEATVSTVVETARTMVTDHYDWGIIAQDMHVNVFNPLFTRTK